ncbi:MAG: sugar ABC transporter substrate-binding protein [Fretibacterium sp.]|nr:sugar ABC transporter substrate-binding protein [Fretibacterium sp.]
MKRTVALCLTLTAALVLCLTAASSARGRRFGASYIADSPFFIAVNDTIRAVLEDNGDTLITLYPNRDQAQQIRQIEELIAQHIDALFLTPVDWQGVAQALAECKAAGIPVINIDAPVYDEELVAGHVASDNLAAGQACAQDLLNRLRGGQIAVLGNSTARTGLERVTTFETAVGANPAFSIVARGDSQGTRGTAKTVMADIIHSYPDIAAVMCISDSVALGAIEALKDAGMAGRVLVYGVNGSPEAKRAISRGEMTGTAGQSARSIGHIAVGMAYRVLDGEKIEKHALAPVLMITAENLNEFFLDGWQ